MTFFKTHYGFENLDRIEKRLAEYKEAFEKGDYSTMESLANTINTGVIEGLVNHIRVQEKEIECKNTLLKKLSEKSTQGNKYVWLNKTTGEFSNSWEYKEWNRSEIAVGKEADNVSKLALEAESVKDDYVLIEYKDVTEKGFQFMQPMRLP